MLTRHGFRILEAPNFGKILRRRVCTPIGAANVFCHKPVGTAPAEPRRKVFRENLWERDGGGNSPDEELRRLPPRVAPNLVGGSSLRSLPSTDSLGRGTRGREHSKAQGRAAHEES